jgi:hypothetical protein
MAEIILIYTLWFILVVALAGVGSLFLVFHFMDSKVRESLNIKSINKFATFLLSGVLLNGALGAVIGSDNDHLVYVLNILQRREFWSSHTFKDIKYIAKNHSDFNVRIAALEALIVASLGKERDDLHSLAVIDKDKLSESSEARINLINLVENRI